MQKTILKALTSAAIVLSSGTTLAADIVDTADTAGTFKTFVEALKAAGLDDTLKHSGPYTVFAPTDEAFRKIPRDTWNALSKDKQKLSQILAYHVIPGKVLVSEVKPGKVASAQGSELVLTSDNGKVTVNGANVTESDVAADNGVIHAIDTVVMPPSQ